MFKYNCNEEDATHKHAQKTKQENITKGLAMCFGAGSINIDIELNEYEPEKTTIHVRKGLVKLLLENEREREKRGEEL